MVEIFSALRDNNLALMEKLLDEGHNVNTQDSDGRTVLHKACDDCNPAAVKLILKHKPQINSMDKEGRTPLHYSCVRDDMDSVVLFLNSGADVNIADNLHQTPLYLATDNNHIDLVKLLLSSRADPNIVDVDNTSPLHKARSSEVVKLLTNYGANIHATTVNNDTPLIHASHHGHLPAVQALCQLKADVNHRGSRDATALHQATDQNQIHIVRYFLTQKPDVSIVDVNNDTALDIARNKGYKDIQELITGYCIERKTNIKGEFSLNHDKYDKSFF